MMHSGGRERIGQVTSVFSPALDFPDQRILLFVAPPGAVSEALATALEHEFSWISVRRLSTPQLACKPLDSDVQLILIDDSFLPTLLTEQERLAAFHPDATLAVMTSSSPMCSRELLRIVENSNIQNVLPMDVNLDIWLSIIRIMLRGGKYIPPALLQYMQHSQLDEPAPASSSETQPLCSSDQRGKTMEELTKRELEVLSKVARGFQNKIIASDLGLSEHTVKIHIHNVITKLGVHNRTEAALKYIEYQNGNQESPVPTAAKHSDDWNDSDTDE